MRSLVMLFFAVATFLLGTATVGIYEGGSLGGSIGFLAIVRLVTFVGPVVFLVAAVAFFVKDSRA